VGRSLDADVGQLRAAGYRARGSDSARGDRGERGAAGFLDAASSAVAVGSSGGGRARPGMKLPGPPPDAVPIRPKRGSGSNKGAGGGKPASNGGGNAGNINGGGGDPVEVAAAAPSASNVGFGARGGGWSGASRPADLHKHLADDDRLFDLEAAAVEEEEAYTKQVAAGGAGFSSAVGSGPRSLAVADINARDGTDDMNLPGGEDMYGAEGGDSEGSIAAIAAAAAAGLPSEVLERFAVLEEQLRIATGCANEYCRERDMALTELDSALAGVRDLGREKEALEEALNDAEEVAGRKTSAAAAMATQLRELGEAAAASSGHLAVANRAAANATAAAAVAHKAAAASATHNGGGDDINSVETSSSGAAVVTTKKTGPMAEMEEAMQEISELQAKTAEAIGGAEGTTSARGGRGGLGGATSRRGGEGTSASDKKEQQDLALLQGRVEMSRSIMRKLYKKNVELEKENQLAKAAALREQEKAAAATAALAAARQAPDSGGDSGGDHSSGTISGSSGGLGLAAMGIGAPPAPGAPSIYATMVRERDKTIDDLRAAVATLKRDQRASEGNKASSAAALSAADLQEVVSQSAQHFTKYKQIRADYRRLLTRRVETVRRAPGASTEARKVVEELHHRLNREIQEREAEAAIYSARLYDTEQQQGDWYVERRLLEGRVERLGGEVAERDRLDAQIEACVAHLFERMRLLEKTNSTLIEKLGSAGLDGEAAEAAAAALLLQPLEVSADVAKALPALTEGDAVEVAE